MGGQTQHKARPQVGRPNATQGTSASWVPQRTSTSWAPQRNTRHVRNARQGTSASSAAQRTSATQTQGTSAIWAPQRNARHVRKMVTQTQNSSATKTSTQGSTRLKDAAGGWIRTNFGLEVDFLIRPHQGWAPQRNARHVRKLGAPTQRKARPQDGQPNAKLIRNENVHTREH
jgi:hypothetical protein